MAGGVVVIDTEQRDMVVGDCVVVEQGQDQRRSRKCRDQSKIAL
jgi:mannose-6-phosphate isomerase-like protein (cupin superfamily)